MPRRLMVSTAWPISVRTLFRNFSLAGVAKKRSRTSTRVPGGWAAGRGPRLRPPSTAMVHADSAPGGRLVMESRLTAPMEGRASPRNPRVAMADRSSPGSLEVAWRCTASSSSSAVMPPPSSATEIRARPPSLITTSMRVAPESMLFSTSSLTADAGRSTTSPAAMRLTTDSGSRRMVMASSLSGLCNGLSCRWWRSRGRRPGLRPSIPRGSCRPAACPVPRPIGRRN